MFICLLFTLSLCLSLSFPLSLALSRSSLLSVSDSESYFLCLCILCHSCMGISCLSFLHGQYMCVINCVSIFDISVINSTSPNLIYIYVMQYRCIIFFSPLSEPLTISRSFFELLAFRVYKAASPVYIDRLRVSLRTCSHCRSRVTLEQGSVALATTIIVCAVVSQCD
jgi:hypothetical protein